MREHDHREVIAGDMYHNAIYIGKDNHPSWRKYKHKLITTKYNDSVMSIDVDNRVAGYYSGQFTDYGIYRTRDYIYSIYSYNSTAILASADGGYDYHPRFRSSESANYSTRNNKRYKANQLITMYRKGNVSPTGHYAYKIGTFHLDEYGMIDGISWSAEHPMDIEPLYETPSYLKWTDKGALFIGYEGIWEITDNGYDMVGHFVGDYRGFTRLNNGVYVCATFGADKTSSGYLNVMSLQWSSDMWLWQKEIVWHENSTSSLPKERICSINLGNVVYYYFKCWHSSSVWELKVFKFYGSGWDEIVIPQYIDVTIDEDMVGSIVKESRYKKIRLVFSNKDTVTADDDTYVTYLSNSLTGTYDYAHYPDDGANGIMSIDGRIPANRPEFILISSESSDEGSYMIYLDNMEFKESTNNFAFLLGSYDSSKGKEFIYEKDYVF
ncbi:MAG: hypothetical protein MJ007_01900 [Paludibacteraceae bacterium]|nr:hypothetical protein [Paludibacteraceae bacterium]